MKNKKNLIIALIALIVTVAGLLTVYLMTRPDSEKNVDISTPSDAEGVSFTLTVVHADGSKKKFSYTTTAPILGDFLVEQGVVEIGDVDDGMFAYADGERAVYEESGCYWGFYVNGDYAVQGLFTTPIEADTHYELRYEDGSSWS